MEKKMMTSAMTSSSSSTRVRDSRTNSSRCRLLPDLIPRDLVHQINSRFFL